MTEEPLEEGVQLYRERVDYLEVIDFIKSVAVYSQTEDEGLLSMLDTEVGKAGLVGTDIALLLPEDEESLLAAYEMEPYLLGSASGTIERGYTILLFPLSLQIHGRDIRRTLRHELAHIKYGDCDLLASNLPRFLKEVHRYLIAEPRAELYACFE